MMCMHGKAGSIGLGLQHQHASTQIGTSQVCDVRAGCMQQMSCYGSEDGHTYSHARHKRAHVQVCARSTETWLPPTSPTACSACARIRTCAPASGHAASARMLLPGLTLSGSISGTWSSATRRSRSTAMAALFPAAFASTGCGPLLVPTACRLLQRASTMGTLPYLCTAHECHLCHCADLVRLRG